MENSQGLIYVICHPITDEVVYVGQTIDFKTRQIHHLKSPTNLEMRLWINGLEQENLKPKFVALLTNLPCNELDRTEQFWIYRTLILGAQLKNKSTITTQIQKKFAGNKGLTLQALKNYLTETLRSYKAV